MIPPRVLALRITALLLAAFVFIGVLVAMNLRGTPALSITQSPSPLPITAYFPTNYPPAKETLQVAAFETQQTVLLTVTVDELTPSPTGTLWRFFPHYYPTVTPGPTQASTPAGDGAIFDGPDFPPGVDARNKWQFDMDGKRTVVYAGAEHTGIMQAPAQVQGMVKVTQFMIDTPGWDLNDGGLFPTPDRTGGVRIVGAQGMRLILISDSGKTYYFDVAAEQFVPSLTASVPTATLWPTWTPFPTFRPTLIGDAPHNPINAGFYSPNNTPLHYKLNYAGDEHWFRFRLPTPGTFQVHLTQLSADYDLFVYSMTRIRYRGHDGQDTTPGTVDKLVVMNNVPADDYMVRVVGANNAFDPVHPYQLEFDVIPLTPMPGSAVTSTGTTTPRSSQ